MHRQRLRAQRRGVARHAARGPGLLRRQERPRDDDQSARALGGPSQHPRQRRQPRFHRDGELRRLGSRRAGPLSRGGPAREIRPARRGGRRGGLSGLRAGVLYLRRDPARSRWPVGLACPGIEEGEGTARVVAGRRRLLFVTGQLAKEALERTLRGMAVGLDWRVEALRIKVAALLTTDYLKATLHSPDCDAVYLPGLC